MAVAAGGSLSDILFVLLCDSQFSSITSLGGEEDGDTAGRHSAYCDMATQSQLSLPTRAGIPGLHIFQTHAQYKYQTKIQ